MRLELTGPLLLRKGGMPDSRHGRKVLTAVAVCLKMCAPDCVRHDLRLARQPSAPLVSCSSGRPVSHVPLSGATYSLVPLAEGRQSHVSRVAGPGPQAWRSGRGGRIRTCE